MAWLSVRVVVGPKSHLHDVSSELLLQSNDTNPAAYRRGR
jgi:hypothetical protein